MATVTIELDQATVAILQAKAATQGVSLDALLRHLATQRRNRKGRNFSADKLGTVHD